MRHEMIYIDGEFSLHRPKKEDKCKLIQIVENIYSHGVIVEFKYSTKREKSETIKVTENGKITLFPNLEIFLAHNKEFESVFVKSQINETSDIELTRANGDKVNLTHFHV